MVKENVVSHEKHRKDQQTELKDQKLTCNRFSQLAADRQKGGPLVDALYATYIRRALSKQGWTHTHTQRELSSAR